jgi:hypothetical protein
VSGPPRPRRAAPAGSQLRLGDSRALALRTLAGARARHPQAARRHLDELAGAPAQHLRRGWRAPRRRSRARAPVPRDRRGARARCARSTRGSRDVVRPRGRGAWDGGGARHLVQHHGRLRGLVVELPRSAAPARRDGVVCSSTPGAPAPRARRARRGSALRSTSAVAPGRASPAAPAAGTTRCGAGPERRRAGLVRGSWFAPPPPPGGAYGRCSRTSRFPPLPPPTSTRGPPARYAARYVEILRSLRRRPLPLRAGAPVHRARSRPASSRSRRAVGVGAAGGLRA